MRAPYRWSESGAVHICAAGWDGTVLVDAREGQRQVVNGQRMAGCGQRRIRDRIACDTGARERFTSSLERLKEKTRGGAALMNHIHRMGTQRDPGGLGDQRDNVAGPSSLDRLSCGRPISLTRPPRWNGRHNYPTAPHLSPSVFSFAPSIHVRDFRSTEQRGRGPSIRSSLCRISPRPSSVGPRPSLAMSYLSHCREDLEIAASLRLG